MRALALLLLFVFPSVLAQCYSHADCFTCVSDPNCGWCASAPSCWPGNSTGPTNPFQTCSNGAWNFGSCAPVVLQDGRQYVDNNAQQGSYDSYVFNVVDTSRSVTISVSSSPTSAHVLFASQTIQQPTSGNYTWTGGSSISLRAGSLSVGPLYISVYNTVSVGYSIVVNTFASASDGMVLLNGEVNGRFMHVYAPDNATCRAAVVAFSEICSQVNSYCDKNNGFTLRCTSMRVADVQAINSQFSGLRYDFSAYSPCCFSGPFSKSNSSGVVLIAFEGALQTGAVVQYATVADCLKGALTMSTNCQFTVSCNKDRSVKYFVVDSCETPQGFPCECTVLPFAPGQTFRGITFQAFGWPPAKQPQLASKAMRIK